jgi:peptidoglycan hydrolase CwlO-like protein
VEALRDKVSLLSRQLADNEDNTTAQGGRIGELQEQLQQEENAAAELSKELEDLQAQMRQEAEHSTAQTAQIEELKQVLQDRQDAAARAEKTWANEKALLCQVFFQR